MCVGFLGSQNYFFLVKGFEPLYVTELFAAYEGKGEGPPIMQTLGMKLVHLEEGKSLLTMDVESEISQSHGDSARRRS